MTQLTLTEQVSVMDTTAKVQKYGHLLNYLRETLVDFEHRRLDVPGMANVFGIPTCEVYSALRFLRADGYLIKHNKRENRFMLYRIGPPFRNVTPEWLTYQVQAAQIAANARNNPKPTPTPKPEPTPQPANYGLLYPDGVVDKTWFETLEQVQSGAQRMVLDSEYRSVIVIHKVGELTTSITVSFDKL